MTKVNMTLGNVPWMQLLHFFSAHIQKEEKQRALGSGSHMRNCFIAARERSVRSVEFVYGHSQLGPERMLPLTCISFSPASPSPQVPYPFLHWLSERGSSWAFGFMLKRLTKRRKLHQACNHKLSPIFWHFIQSFLFPCGSGKLLLPEKTI